jgi:hypothetical protein
VRADLADKTLAEAETGARTGLNAIALQEGGRIDTHLAPERRPVAGSAMWPLGSAGQRERCSDAFD